MDQTSSALGFAIALIFIISVITMIRRHRTVINPICNRPPPPVVTGASLIRISHTYLTKGMRAMIHDQYTQLGSVFTINFFGLKVTFLVGPEVLGHFYQGSESEISLGDILKFTVPMFGKEVLYGVDIATQNEQTRFYVDALKPSNLRSHVGPMLEEVESCEPLAGKDPSMGLFGRTYLQLAAAVSIVVRERNLDAAAAKKFKGPYDVQIFFRSFTDYFSKWEQHGTIDLKGELAQLLMLISIRCLIGREVREKMLKEFYTLFHELSDNGLCLTSILFPYAPTLANYRRDRAHAKLSEILIKIVRSRKSSNQVEQDMLQNLIDSKYRDNRSTTEAEVTGLILNLIFAGTHTSSAASAWTGVCLLSHERFMRATRDEQKQIVQKYGDHINYNALMEMETLQRCIKEALRMHPPTAASFRKVHKNFIVQTKEGDEYEIPRGHIIASPIQFNSNIPHIYKIPDVYDPDRFGPGREEDKVGGKYSYTAFSSGRHPCVGEAYAYMQIKIIWSHLLRNFDLRLVSPFPETDRSKLALEPKGKIMVRYKRLAA